jgi:hypothetical protein
MMDRITLAELAFGCYVYKCLGGEFDDGYDNFVSQTNGNPNIEDERHPKLLFEWLNKWGCRQFKKSDYGLAGTEICDWYSNFSEILFQEDKNILSLTDADFDNVEKVFNGLVTKTACIRQMKGGKQTKVEFGPVGAAKILFALRPKALIPWDSAIYSHLGLDGSACDYTKFLRMAAGWLNELGKDCGKNGFELANLPGKVGRPASTLPKLIDEYLWVTVTRRCKIPSKTVLEQWVHWS